MSTQGTELRKTVLLKNWINSAKRNPESYRIIAKYLKGELANATVKFMWLDELFDSLRAQMAQLWSEVAAKDLMILSIV